MRLLRPTWFEIDLDAAVDNLRAIRRLVGPGRKIVAVVKADAYGFGSLEMGRAFAAHGADALGVADVADGVRLRDAGLTLPILMYPNALPEAADDAIGADLIPTLTVLDAACAYDDAAARRARPADVFVKVDVGLERLGVPADQAVKLVLAIRDLAGLRLAGLCTHLHVPTGADPAYVEWQFGRFTAVLDALAAQGVDVPIRLAASSPLVLGFPSTYLNAVDPGRMLYGYGHEAVAGPVVLRPTGRAWLASTLEAPRPAEPTKAAAWRAAADEEPAAGRARSAAPGQRAARSVHERRGRLVVRRVLALRLLRRTGAQVLQRQLAGHGGADRVHARLRHRLGPVRRPDDPRPHPRGRARDEDAAPAARLHARARARLPGAARVLLRVARLGGRPRFVGIRRPRLERADHPARGAAGVVGLRHHGVLRAHRHHARGGRDPAHARAAGRGGPDARAADARGGGGRGAGSGRLAGARGRGAMITIAFLIVMLIVTVVLTLMGGGTSAPIGELALVSGVFIVFFCAGVYVAAALGMLGLLAGFALSERPLHLFIGEVIWIPSVNFVLVAVPLFLLMGELLLRAGLSERLYRALNLWFGRLPGGLLHTNIVSSP